MRIPLAPQGPENNTPCFGFSCCEDRSSTERVQGVVLVDFVREASGIGIVAVSGEGWIRDHGGLEVESAVAKIEQEIWNCVF